MILIYALSALGVGTNGAYYLSELACRADQLRKWYAFILSNCPSIPVNS